MRRALLLSGALLGSAWALAQAAEPAREAEAQAQIRVVLESFRTALIEKDKPRFMALFHGEAIPWLAELSAGEAITIGQPLPNYQLMVIAPDVENGLRLQPQGETGELCISGPGVAAGYLGRLDLTAQKFLPNPGSTGVHR